MESEYIGVSDAVKKVVWLKKFIAGLDVVPRITNPVDLYCDKNLPIAQAKKPRLHQRTKHILR